MQLELKIDSTLLITRCAFAALALGCLVTVLPQFALSFGDVNCGIGRYAFQWPHRAFPSAFNRMYGDMYSGHLEGSAFVLAIVFWTVFSLAFVYMTKMWRFVVFAGSYLLAVLAVEAAFSLILSATTYSQKLPFSFCAPLQ